MILARQESYLLRVLQTNVGLELLITVKPVFPDNLGKLKYNGQRLRESALTFLRVSFLHAFF